MAKQKLFQDSSCPVARSIDIIGDKWSLLILRDCFDGIRRFSEFQESLGIAKNILADRLKMLTQEEILVIAPASDGSAYQEYVLSAKGKTLFPVVVSLRQWGELELFKDNEKHSILVDQKNSQPIQKIEIRNQAGEVIDPLETRVNKVN